MRNSLPKLVWGAAIGAPGTDPVATDLSTAGNVNIGTHSWKVTFLDVTGGETTPSAKSNVITVAGAATQVSVTLPTGPVGTVSRALYRTVAGDTGSWKLVKTVTDNTTASTTDNVADASLGAAAPSADTTHSFVLTAGFPLDNPATYGEPREGSEVGQSTGGAEDAWIVGTDEYLEGDLRWIPGTTGTATGWDGAAGVNAALAWCRGKNLARWVPDATTPTTYLSVYLVEPAKGTPTIEAADGTRRIHLKLRSSDGSAFTGY